MLLVAVASAGARPVGPPDPSFGRDGHELVKLPSGTDDLDPAAAAGLPGGRTAILFAEQLAIVGSTGRIESVTPLPDAPGAEQKVTSLAAGPSGEILVAGSAGQLKGTTPPPWPSEGMIVRYEPNGELDQGFGNGGVLTSTFGLAPPTVTSHTFGGGTIGSPLSPAMVRIDGIAADTRGRILVTGTRAVDRVECRHSPGLIREAFVARLRPDGSLDRSFGTQGVVGLALGSTPFNDIGPPVPGPKGSVYLNPGVPSYYCTEYLELAAHVIHLDSNGTLDPRFSGGDVVLPHESSRVELAAEPGGGVMVLSNEHRDFFRLLGDGRIDSRFGRGGYAKLGPGSSRDWLEGLDVDAGGCIWGFGTNLAHGRTRFLVARFDSRGDLERHFGQEGVAFTGFPTERFVEPATGILDRRDRLTMVGSAGHGDYFHELAIARYLPPGRCP
jgi:uncharacterized delta-60 repeat protein